MMDGWDKGMGVFGWIVMAFLWVGVVALIVAGVRRAALHRPFTNRP